MSDSIQFTRNYTDLSTRQGFQFEFFCDRCGNGHRTHFKPYVVGAASSALDVASGLLGGIFGRAASAADSINSATYERAQDAAFIEAIKELKPKFVQCPRCSSWVCRERCWNNKRGLCKECAPDLAVEMSALQSDKALEAAREKAQIDEDDEQQVSGNWKKTIKATCPECGAPLAMNAKFCPECGAKLQAAAFCKECGAKLQPGAKFCAECGAKTGS